MNTEQLKTALQDIQALIRINETEEAQRQLIILEYEVHRACCIHAPYCDDGCSGGD